MRRAVAILIAPLVVVCAAHAQPVLTPAVPVDAPVGGPAARDQQWEALAYGAGVYFAVWRTGDKSKPGDLFQVQGARFDGAGKLLDDPPIAIVVGTAAAPAGVAFDGQNFIVVWTEGANAPTGGAIHARYYDPMGVPVGAAFDIVRKDIANGPIVTAGGGHSMIVWPDSMSSWVVTATILDDKGAAVKSDVPLYTSAPRKVGFVATWGGQNPNNFLVAWENDVNNPRTMQAITVDAQGNATAPVQLASGMSSNTINDLAVASDGSTYAAVWSDRRSGVNEIWGRAIPFNGVLMGPDYLVAKGHGTGNDRPQLTYAGGGFLTVWQAREKVINTAQLWGARFAADGTRFDGEGVKVNLGQPGSNEMLPYSGEGRKASIAAGGGTAFVTWKRQAAWMYGDDVLALPLDPMAPGPKGSFELGGGWNHQFARSIATNNLVFLVVWEDHRSFGATGTDIYGMRVTLDGKPIDPAPFPISTAPGNQYLPALSAYPGGEFLVAWADARAAASGGDTDVRAARVGSMGPPTPDFLVGGGMRAQLAPAVAAKPDGWLVVWEDWTLVSGVDESFPTPGLGQAIVDSMGNVSGQRALFDAKSDHEIACAPAVTATDMGRFFVAYEKPCSQMAGLSFYGGMNSLLPRLEGIWLSADGSAVTLPLSVSLPMAPLNHVQSAPAVAALPGGAVAVVWREVEQGVHLPAMVLAEKMGGSPLASSPDLAKGVIVDAPALVADANGTLVLSWIDRSGKAVRGLRTDSLLKEIDGAPFELAPGETFRVDTPPVTLPASNYFFPSRASAGDDLPLAPRATPPAALALTETGQVLVAWDHAEPRAGGIVSRVQFRTFGAGARGAPCTSPDECADHLCTGGQCCNVPCDGICQACGVDGCVVAPPTDDRCGAGNGGVVSCAALDTVCRTYGDAPMHQCVAFGQCATAADPVVCTQHTNAPAGTPCPSAACAGGNGQCRDGSCDCPGGALPDPAGRIPAPAGACSIARAKSSAWILLLPLGLVVLARRRRLAVALASLLAAGCGTALEIDVSLKETLLRNTDTARIVVHPIDGTFPAAALREVSPGLTVANVDYDGDAAPDIVVTVGPSFPLRPLNRFVLHPSLVGAPIQLTVSAEAFDTAQNRLAVDRAKAVLQAGAQHAERELELSCGETCVGTEQVKLSDRPRVDVPAGLTALAIGRVRSPTRGDLIAADAQFGPPLRPNAGRIEVHLGAGDLALSAKANLSCDGAGPGDQLGAALAVADLDGKGGDDLVVGAPGAGGSRGAVYVIYSWPGDTVDLAALPMNTAVATGGAAGDRLGSALALLDIDGDGKPEVIAGAPGANGGNGALVALRAADFKPGQSVAVPVDRVIVGPAGAAIGGALSSLRDQLAVGAPLAKDAGKPAGSVYLVGARDFAGPASTLDKAPRWLGQGGGFGSSVLLADLDGSSGAWLVAGAPEFGGGSVAAVRAADLVPGDNAAAKAARTIRMAAGVTGVGKALVRIPWPFGDGLLVGASTANANTGAASLVRGTTSAIVPSMQLDAGGRPAALQLIGGEKDGAGSHFALGDLDGDGTPDLAVGASGPVGAAIYVIRGPLL